MRLHKFAKNVFQMFIVTQLGFAHVIALGLNSVDVPCLAGNMFNCLNASFIGASIITIGVQ